MVHLDSHNTMDELECHLDSLEKLKYSELQKLAKKCGIRANVKSDKIIHTLRELANCPPNKSHAEKDDQSKRTPVKESQEEDTTTDTEKETKRKKRRGKMCKKTTRKYKYTKQSSDEDDEIHIKESLLQSTMQMSKANVTEKNSESSLSEQMKCTTPVTDKVTPKPSSGRRVLTPARMMTPSRKDSALKSKPTTPAMAARSSSGRHSSVKKSRLSKAATPSSENPRKKRCLSSPQNKTPQSALSCSQNVVSSEQKGDSARKHSADSVCNKNADSAKQPSRRDTYSLDEASPNVKDIISAMKDDMTQEEQKEAPLDKLEEKVQQKKTSKENNGSNIPRYMGMNKTVDNKKKTPAKDWSKIHQLEWSKMDSIDEYLAKKRKRTEAMMQSVKKLRMMAEQVKSNLDLVNTSKTPQTETKHKSVTKQTGSSSAKKAVKSKTALFQSPRTGSFRPKVTSVSKANFNFSSIYSKRGTPKTPGSMLRRSPRLGSADKLKTKKQSPTTERWGTATKPKVLPPSATKENTISTSKETKKATAGTPFKQVLNTSLPINSTKTFNIAESLAKPITWKPHKGKLKPFTISSLYTHQIDVKEVKVKSREDRRKEHSVQRHEKRCDVLAKRRKIDA